MRLYFRLRWIGYEHSFHAFSYRLGYKIRLGQMCSMQFSRFQHLHNDDSREKPRSETLAIHLRSKYMSDQPRLEGNDDSWVKMCHLCRV
jgi:hypothetical protein